MQTMNREVELMAEREAEELARVVERLDKQDRERVYWLAKEMLQAVSSPRERGTLIDARRLFESRRRRNIPPLQQSGEARNGRS
jgi:hypothetical protein